MQRIRNALSDLLVGIILILVAVWLLKGVFRMVVWAANLILIVILVVVALRVAAKLRR